MSYLALARKWRPTKFNEVVGQAHVLTALENALAQNRLHHAYLFSGTRGVGKTTIGRLFAKGLNCETGITATPCGECATCKEIDQGRFVDLLEIDAASRTKVEDTRELLDNVQYKPARGRFKVYLIDEVHMLSRHSFNALLKTLEEPPEYVKFLLATTDPQKLPVTILSRCLQFHLKPINVENIQHQLEHILAAEQVSSESKALAMIAHAADGSMRDALSLTDQAIALGNGQVQQDVVSHMLGTLDTDQALHLLQAISSTQPQTVMDSIEALAQNGVEWDGLLQQLAAQLHRVAMYQALPSSIDKAQPDAEKIQWLAKSLSPQDVQLYYQIAIKGRDDLSLSPTPRVGIEMITLRMMAFRPSQASVAQVISTQPAAVAPSQPQTVQPAAAPVSASQAPHAAPRVQPQPAEYERPSAPPPSVPEPMIEPVPQPAPQSASQPEVPVQQSTVESERKPSPMVGLRHQLRSQRQGLAQKGSDPKKPDAASAKPVSVLERVAQRGQHAAQMSPYSATSVDDTPDDEAYQWRPTQNLPVETQVKSELTPTQIKRALEHEKTPEMTEKLIHEAIELDQWASLIQRLHTAKLVEQLALNSTYKKNGASIELTLRPSHAHLNTDKAQSELLQALNDQLNEDCHLSVTIGEDGETPLELRERLYQGKLSRAIDNLVADPNVQFIERRFSAELDKDSVRPI
ncbi:DNA polymerase III subunit gamma/tau [Vibrio fluvialis]|uniref:DNA polymerase III subunit gamma/tau n=1 Tax=Vibrio sp. bablab_jr001 TaxID=2755067 RepID=UPI0018F1E800|nr:DNA polymerase III subunit gamma/tau [Vibrio sp. bablab_jr001]EKO3399283.1 DNA polymerase III subunit gamma/tau [Vibrio fluvialis]EKO3474483.1 DNA polymerase III subunit gamma/tau [Vibrio fluvialis]MBY8116848.1 DNA polymerase III subunit gamma/tau [Vibrio fluvialis]MBY8248164.1 DNA polymerase III subunit gamma/tau [Vibrio fluvialis]MBY8281479.1 DNA polymerase III subunit gamma/tau [Vibrio fluvialis]